MDDSPHHAEPAPETGRGSLDSLGSKFIEKAQKEGCWTLLRRFFRWLTFWATLAYLTFLLVLGLCLAWVGEKNLVTAFMLYWPPMLWLLPLLPMMGMALLFHRRSLFLQVAAAVAFSSLSLGWTWHGEKDRTEDSLTVMTYNRGQHGNHSLQPFKKATQPDLLVLQDAPGKATAFGRSEDYSEFVETRSLGEHTLLSRYPILEQSILPVQPPRTRNRAARFVIDWKGTRVAIYSVHLQTPREALQSYMRGSFLYGLVGLPGTPWEARRLKMQEFWDLQVQDVETILKAVRAETIPTIVLGDFNAPSSGYIHRLITRELADAHAEAGRGFGFSFPGSTRNPLSAGGPWMRIDCVFFTPQWEALNSITEPDRPSQHRAVVATLRLKAP